MKIIVTCCGKLHAFNLAEQLDKRGHLHKFITTFYSKNKGILPKFREDREKIDFKKVICNISSEVLGKGFKKVPIIGDLVPWNYFALQTFDYWARSQIDKCDILVAWSGGALNTLKKGKILGAKTIVERGSTHILFQKEILEEEYEKFGIKGYPVDKKILEKELIEYDIADYISVPSEFAKQTYVNKGISSKKLICVPYGVDLSNFKKIPKEDKTFRVIFVGGLTLRKGVHYLLKAFSELNLVDAELVLIGEVSKEIEYFLRRYQNYYKYKGVIPHLQLYKYLSQGSVFVLPSIEEGLAMVIPQAMSCGLPVICTTNTGATEITRDNEEGFIVPIRNVEVLKEKILHLYENEEECKYMSQMSLKRIKDFTWDHYGEKIVENYSKLLGK